MIPFYFGPSANELFGAYDSPSGVSYRGVVLCYPWGQEYLCAHRAFAVLARQLAEAGHHVLRFDYYGTGDSAGTGLEGSLSRWRRDVELSLDEIQAMVELRSVALVGLRLGAALAAWVARERRDVDRVVLWDPVFDGNAYLDELLDKPGHVTTSTAYREDEAREGGEIYDVLGFPLTPTLREAIRKIRPVEYSELPRTMLLSTLDTRAGHAPLIAALETGKVDHTAEHVAGPIAWLEDREFGSGGIPVQGLRRIAQWLS